jgi:hypothetical protein
LGVAENNRTVVSRTCENGRAIATDDSSGKPAFLQSQGERSANQAGADDRYLANGHQIFSPQGHRGTEKAEVITKSISRVRSSIRFSLLCLCVSVVSFLLRRSCGRRQAQSCAADPSIRRIDRDRATERRPIMPCRDRDAPRLKAHRRRRPRTPVP